jgi:purine-binding chemotaxis protein CheW
MMNAAPTSANAVHVFEAAEQYIAFTVEGQLFGAPVLDVQDVLSAQQITPIPMAPPAVSGSLNIRGRIVTAIDTRVLLGMAPCKDTARCTNIVISHKDFSYALLVDQVSEILSLRAGDSSHHSGNLSSHWKHLSTGVYTLPQGLLVAIDVKKLLDTEVTTH